MLLLLCAAWACGDDADDQPEAVSVEVASEAGPPVAPLAAATLSGVVLGAGLMVWRGRSA